MSCGEINFLEGGTLKNTSVIGGTINQAVVQGCAVDACNITNLRDIDNASAEAIMTAISKLPPSVLRLLAEALYASAECPPGFPPPPPPPFRRCVPPPCPPVPPNAAPVMFDFGETGTPGVMPSAPSGEDNGSSIPSGNISGGTMTEEEGEW